MVNIHAIDWIIVAGYFAIILGLAWWVIKQRKDTSTDYFLAGRHLGWFIVGASIFASNIGSEHLVGLAGSGATDGVAMAHYELHAWCLLILGWVMVPFYMRSKVFTMPEFLERRFSPTARTVLSVISLVAYVLTKIAVGIFAGGVVFSVLLPNMNLFGLDSFWVGSILVIVLTGIYTILGGLRAVAYTEALQTVVLVLGSILVTIFGLKALGGWSVLRDVCGSDMFNLWKPLVPAGIEGTWAPVRESGRMAWYFNDNYPWLGMLFCAPIIGLWYWCTDQYIVQRALGAPNEQQARRGSICAAFLKLLPVFIFIIPGMICFAIAKSGQVAAIQNIFFNSQGELIRDNAQQAFPLLVAYVHLAPPIFVVFFLGVFNKRLNSKGCLAALITGFIMGLFRLIVDTPVKLASDFAYSEGSFFWIVNNIFFQYYSLLIFIVCVAVMFIVSHLTEAPAYKKISGLTYATLTDEHRKETRASWNYRDVLTSAIVVILIVAAYLYFTG